jgi:ubiquinone/menaquinone biosynthesis C-methylase UbiE
MNPPNDKKDIKKWWADNPMTYGDVHGTTVYSEEDAGQDVSFGTVDFFDRVDKTFYNWNHFLHDQSGYFGKIFPSQRFGGKNVLEIGCGMGTMAMNWAQHDAHIHVVDLNPKAVTETRQRFRLLGLPGQIIQGDANVLPFADDTFDYLYSWVVLHHSEALDRSFQEVFRVLKPGGEFGIMLYNRDSVLYWYFIRFIEGFLHAESRFLSPLQLSSRYTDGDKTEGNPHTWPVTEEEMKQMLQKYCSRLEFRLLGADIDFALHEVSLLPALARKIPLALRKAAARRWGWSIWIHGTAK